MELNRYDWSGEILFVWISSTRLYSVYTAREIKGFEIEPHKCRHL